MATTTTETPADINARDDDGRTKIYRAAETGDAAEVARLLELKVDFELPTTDYKYVSLFNDKKLFINIFQFDSQHSYTPLHIACEMGHAPVVRLLLRAGAKLEAKERHYGFACVDLNEFMTSRILFGCVM